jgi:hypothetical protein
MRWPAEPWTWPASRPRRISRARIECARLLESLSLRLLMQSCLSVSAVCCAEPTLADIAAGSAGIAAERTTASAVQYELLHPPVQEFGDVEHVFRRAGHLVDPAELLQPLAGAAEDAQQFALQRQLVDAAGKRVGAVEDRLRSGRDADRPRRSGRRARRSPTARAPSPKLCYSRSFAASGRLSSATGRRALHVPGPQMLARADIYPDR